MAPKQKTFELIPDLPGIGQAQQLPADSVAAAVQSRPPMTTKQAKKLYRQKGKGPRLSKTEQRRIDLMEQDRIRKEFEKEKAQARARTARDKRKAKEDKERDDKRKKGLPLVDVHPSQDTISRFISRLGFAGKKHTPLDTVQEAESESATEVESDADGQGDPCEGREGYHPQEHKVEVTGKENEELVDALDASAARAAKRRKLDQSTSGFLDKMIHIPSQRPAGPVARLAPEMENESWSRPSSIDTDDLATETMLEDQLIADVEVASSRSATKSSPNRQSPAREPLPSRVQPPPHAPILHRSPSPRRPRPQSQPPKFQEFQARHLADGTRVPLKDVSPTNHPRAKVKPVEDVFKKPASPFIPGGRQSPAFRPAVAARPPAPPRFKSLAGNFTARSGRPTFLPKPFKAAPTLLPLQASPNYAGSRRHTVQTAEPFPTSTQLLVMNHLDELFPSPSQEARELRDDQQPPKAIKVLTSPPSSRHRHPFPTGAPVGPHHGRPPGVAPRRPKLPAEDQPDENAPPGIPFLATQDLILSSQDIEELDTPSKVGTESAPRALHVASHAESLTFPSEKLTLSSDGIIRLVSGARGPRDTTSTATLRSADAMSVDYCRHLPDSGNELGHRGRFVSQGSKVLAPCPTQALIHPRTQRHQGPRTRHSPSRSASQQNLSISQKRIGEHDAVGQGQSNDGFDNRPPTFRCPRSPVKDSRANSHPNSSSASLRSLKGLAVPTVSLPKKRMFGSSGPGAEVLVAMERSYKHNLSEERQREEELLPEPGKTLAGDHQDDLSEIAEDDFLDDELDSEAFLAYNLEELPDDLECGARSPAASGPRIYPKTGTDAMYAATNKASKDRAVPTASQETDYGDFDFEAGEELDMLTDIVWADDELSEYDGM